ncbi:putative phosphate transport protein (TIGR00153 family) [Methanofollis sp. W23]|nr:putative phosphate transport protein (TIGR00153 family) [Methanofollis sp. W23]
MFEKQADTVNEGGKLLHALVNDYVDVKNKCHMIKEIEHRGDEIAHQVYEQLNLTFITPLEPEEISRLATALDDVLDYIDGTSQQMYGYGVTETDELMKELARLIYLSTQEIQVAVRLIRTMDDPRAIEKHCIEINRLENLADAVLADAIKNLFSTNDAITIIKLKDIYENLEEATDRCEDVANVLSDIAIRHS